MASGLLIDYLGSGPIASRPASLTIFAGSVGLWFATDTNILSAWDGSTWDNVGGGGTPGGADTQVQFNDGGAFGGDAGLVYNKTTNTLTVEDVTTTGLILTAAAATGGAGLNIPHGTAPTTPNNGDLWSTTTGFFGRVNGSTVGPFGAGGGGASAGWQIGYASTISTTVASTTDTSIPLDTTIPQNTEGVAYASLDTTITPAEATSLLDVEVIINTVSQSVAGTPRFALFRDAGADAIAAGFCPSLGGGGIDTMCLRTIVSASAVTATTFKLRWCASGGTAEILQAGGINYFGTSNKAIMIIREIKQ